MHGAFPHAATQAAPMSTAPAIDTSVALLAAARQLLPQLERGQRIDAAILRSAMEAAFGASDASPPPTGACSAGFSPSSSAIGERTLAEARASHDLSHLGRKDHDREQRRLATRRAGEAGGFAISACDRRGTLT